MAASLTKLTFASQSVSCGTAVTLTGTRCPSAGSFCAVTVTGGRVSRGVCCDGACAQAERGNSKARHGDREERSRTHRKIIYEWRDRKLRE